MNISIVKSSYFESSASKSDDLTFKVVINGVEIHTHITSWIKVTDMTEIKSFEDFQNANIQRLSEAIAGKSSQEALEYLSGVIEGFAFEIWEKKEKSWAAEVLKNQIKKTVEVEKSRILPDYNPANLSKVSRKSKSKTGSEVKGDKTIALFGKLGISEADAADAIKKMLAQTFEMGLGKHSTPVSKFKICTKCKAMNTESMTNCMVCSTSLEVTQPTECEFCKNPRIQGQSYCTDHRPAIIPVECEFCKVMVNDGSKLCAEHKESK